MIDSDLALSRLCWLWAAMNAIISLVAIGLGQPLTAPLQCRVPVAAKGDIKGGPPLVHTFELTHRGSGMLTITKLEAGCGCIRRTLSQAALKPGETAKLTVEINTLTQPDGPNRWPVVVGYATADGVRGELALAVGATISRQVIVNPPQIAFSTSGEATQAIAVTDRRRKGLTIVKAVSSSPHLTAAIGKGELQANGNRTQSIALRLAAATPAGHRDEMLVLQTDDPEYPEFRVPVRVLKKAAGAVSAAPEAVAVRFAAGQDAVSTLVQLRAPDGKKVRIAAAESDAASVTVKYSSAAAAVATVRISVGSSAKDGSGFVKLHLAEPKEQVVLVPVSWSSGKRP
jgi:hypothetical protein